MIQDILIFAALVWTAAFLIYRLVSRMAKMMGNEIAASPEVPEAGHSEDSQLLHRNPGGIGLMSKSGFYTSSSTD